MSKPMPSFLGALRALQLPGLVRVVLVVLSFASHQQHVSCFSFTAPAPASSFPAGWRHQPDRSSRVQKTTMAMRLQQPRGCAATPLQKKSVAICGAGGYLGGAIFGFCQRASNLYGTGITGANNMPRSISATAEGSQCLNRVLSKGFKLAYAGEQHMRLTDMDDVQHITERIKGMDAVFVGTVNQLEVRSVTGNTYETGPNSKTNEFYLDERKVVGMGEITADLDVHLNLFRNIVTACKNADSVKHLVVIQTPNTPSAEPFAQILDEAGVPFTYIYTSEGSEWQYCKDWTFEKGVVALDALKVEHATLADNYLSKSGYEVGVWADTLPDSSSLSSSSSSSSSPEDATASSTTCGVYREDLAALAVQSLMCLDWSRSRCIEVSCKSQGTKNGQGEEEAATFRATKPPRSDREWCVNSDALADLLSEVE